MAFFTSVRAAVTSSAILLLASPACADIELSGRWFDPTNASGFVTIVQTGTDVTITWPGGSPTYTGTFDQTRVEATDSGAYLQLTPDSDTSYLQGFESTSPPVSSPVFLSRCECYDTNTNDGDGCSSKCRVEECYTCTGDPSACVPSADAAPCNDRDDCTTGETCSAGSCGGASPVSPCVDVNGQWRTAWGDYEFFGPVRGSSSDYLFVQENGDLLLFDEGSDGSGMPSGVGTIDPATGAMRYQTFDAILCGGFEFDGTASSDSQTFAGTFVHEGMVHYLVCGYDDSTGSGTRCDATLGCDLTDCTGHADGTPCGDGDICTNREACRDEKCSARAKCSICDVCDAEGGCYGEARPDPACLPSANDKSSQLMLKIGRDGDDPSDDIVRWSWKKGAATSLDDFGDAAGSAEMALCLFNGDELVYQYDVDRETTCEEPPCWTEKSDSLAFKSKPLSLKLRSGSEGRSSIQLKSANANFFPIFGVPLLPVTVPLHAQFRIENGACFDSVFDSDGVSKSDNGNFKAKGGLP